MQASSETRSPLQEVFVRSFDEKGQIMDDKDVSQGQNLDTVFEESFRKCPSTNTINTIQQEAGGLRGVCCSESVVDFTQNTTLHGLRYIWLPETLTLRRIIWFFLVAGCISISGYQIMDRVVYFNSLPVNVNVEVKFNNTLVFPSVTICNQNAFRLSKAVEMGWYDLLHFMYTNLRAFNSSRLDQHNASDLTLSDILNVTKHTKEDMIVSCRWKGYACGAQNFSEVMTDHGVCYTFNYPDDSTPGIRSVEAPGADNGLSLILNVEQYEYMQGPHDYAGFKFLIHDHRQFPKVKALGVALPVGQPSFVTMKMMSVDNLPKPHGQCSSPFLDLFSVYSQQNCEVECFTKELIRTCQCRLHFMPHMRGSPRVCTLQEYLDCYLPAEEDLQRAIQSKCHCPVPCHMNIFEPTVTYATTSEFLGSKYLDERNLTALKVSFDKARDIGDRQMNRRIELENQLRQLNKSLQTVRVDAQRMLIDIPTKITIYYRYYRKINDMATSVANLYRNRRSLLERVEKYTKDMMESGQLAMLSHRNERFVISIKNKINQLINNNTTDKCVRSSLFVLAVNEIDTRLAVAKRIKQKLTLLTTSGPMLNIFTMDEREILPENLTTIFDLITHRLLVIKNNTASIIRRMSDYKNILDDAFYKHTFNITHLNYTNLMYLDVAKETGRQIEALYGDSILGPEKQLMQEEEDLILGKFTSYRSSYTKYLDFLQFRTGFNLRRLIKLLRSIKAKYKACHAYLSGGISKLKVARRYFLRSSSKDINLLKANFETFRGDRNQFGDISKDIYVAQFKVIKVSCKIQGKFALYFQQNLSEPCFDDWESYTKNLSPYKLDERHVKITEEPLEQALEDLTQHMREFVRTSKIDTSFMRNNILKVEFFYRDMSYDIITQQIAYDVFGLLCDIGGSMGLFIGASVITLFEILDFACMHSVLKHSNKKDV